MLVLDGGSLTVRDLLALPATGPLDVAVDAAARAHLVDVAAVAAAGAHGGAVYGRTTGVGANRNVPVDADDEGHGLRIIRSHTHDAGDPIPHHLVRAAMVVRANQLARGLSGLRPEVLDALVAALRDGRAPVVGRTGSLGTGDVATFAAVGLALIGERPWSDGATLAYLDTIRAEDALAFMSTNAAVIAQCALMAGEVERLLHTAHVVAALSFVALRGNAEAYAAEVHAARPHPGLVESAAVMRRLVAGAGAAARVQDPLSLRCVPQVHGAALAALDDLQRDLAIELNSATENPLFTGEAPLHHGGFHNATLGLATDRLRLAVAHVADLSVARLTKLHEPALTGQRPFLADGPPAASGTMMVEYTAMAALGEARAAASPAILQSSTVSRGLEDTASFAWQSAMQVPALVDATVTVLACELVAAVRSLRADGPARSLPPALEAAASNAFDLPWIPEDHALAPELAQARAIVAAGL